MEGDIRPETETLASTAAHQEGKCVFRFLTLSARVCLNVCFLVCERVILFVSEKAEII